MHVNCWEGNRAAVQPVFVRSPVRVVRPGLDARKGNAQPHRRKAGRKLARGEGFSLTYEVIGFYDSGLWLVYRGAEGKPLALDFPHLETSPNQDCYCGWLRNPLLAPPIRNPGFC